MASEPKRGCGYRKTNGIYLVAGKPGSPCHRLPLPLHVCPTCNQGIKQARGWTWVNRVLFQPDCTFNPDKLSGPNCDGGVMHYSTCPACNTAMLPETVGLIWIGERFYKTPQEFMKESDQLGISRRVKKIPRGFKLGESWVFLAHPKAISKTVPAEDNESLLETKFTAGVFTAFKPERIEMLLRKSDITPEKRKELEDRGITIIPVDDNDLDHQGTVYDKHEESN